MFNFSFFPLQIIKLLKYTPLMLSHRYKAYLFRSIETHEFWSVQDPLRFVTNLDSSDPDQTRIKKSFNHEKVFLGRKCLCEVLLILNT